MSGKEGRGEKAGEERVEASGFRSLLGVKSGKSVTFEDSRLRGRLTELELEVDRCKSKIKELEERKEKSEERWWRENREMKEEVREVTARMKEMEIEWAEVDKVVCGRGGSEGGMATGGADVRSTWSLSTVGSRRGELSEKEVDSVRKWMRLEESEKRKNNVVIRGLRLRRGGEEGRMELMEWFRKMIDVQCVVRSWVRRGVVLVVELEEEGMKWEIMKCKSRLKGEEVFISEDLSYEERLRQEEIRKWVWRRRREGAKVQMGSGRVKVGSRWYRWKEVVDKIERETEEREGEERERLLAEEETDERAGRGKKGISKSGEERTGEVVDVKSGVEGEED